MKLSTGIDMVEISRIEKSMKNSRFIKKILSKDEIACLKKKGMPAQSVAAAFCAKEAFAKAMGTGMRDFEFDEIEVLHDKLGKPYFRLNGKAKKAVKSKKLKFDVSLTHTKNYAMAFVVAFKG